MPGRGAIDLRSRRPPVQPYQTPLEWSQLVVAGNIRVFVGPVMWSNVPVEVGWDAAAYVEVDWTALTVDEDRWLFVEIDFSGRTVTPKFQADTSLPVDDPDNMLVRWRLSKWKRVSDYRIYKTGRAWDGGCIHLPAIFGPPLA
jgi:hypothetical protein